VRLTASMKRFEKGVYINTQDAYWSKSISGVEKDIPLKVSPAMDMLSSCSEWTYKEADT